MCLTRPLGPKQLARVLLDEVAIDLRATEFRNHVLHGAGWISLLGRWDPWTKRPPRHVRRPSPLPGARSATNAPAADARTCWLWELWKEITR
jgi:hypothetical protein